MTSNMRRKTIISTMIKMAMNITRVLLQHSPSPDERPLRLDGMSGAMPESVFMAPGDSVRAGSRGAATMPPKSVWRCWVGAMEYFLKNPRLSHLGLKVFLKAKWRVL